MSSSFSADSARWVAVAAGAFGGVSVVGGCSLLASSWRVLLRLLSVPLRSINGSPPASEEEAAVWGLSTEEGLPLPPLPTTIMTSVFSLAAPVLLLTDFCFSRISLRLAVHRLSGEPPSPEDLLPPRRCCWRLRRLRLLFLSPMRRMPPTSLSASLFDNISASASSSSSRSINRRIWRWWRRRWCVWRFAYCCSRRMPVHTCSTSEPFIARLVTFRPGMEIMEIAWYTAATSIAPMPPSLTK